MRVLVVHHGPLPRLDLPTTGGALRADWHRRSLLLLGAEVRTLHRDQDGPGGFTGPAHLRALAAEYRPDWILCVAPEDAPALAGIAPLVVDLYAPRLLEAAFAGQQEDAAKTALLAIDAADEVLFSNDQQRVFWLGMLGLAGWDLSQPVGVVVPFVADVDAVAEAGAQMSSHSHGKSKKRATDATLASLPTVIIGGHAWPWQDAAETLLHATKSLAGRARLVSYGLPEVPGVSSRGIVSRGEWLAACAGANVALDRYARHQERELAVSFRQMDYLAAGLPLVSDPWTPLAAQLRESGAGEVDLPLAAALQQCLTASGTAKAAIVQMQQRYSLNTAAAALGTLKVQPRVRTWSAVRWSSEAAAAIVQGATDRQLREAAEAEVSRKREEVSALAEQNRSLTTALGQLSAAMADVAGLRRETVAVLGARLTGQTDEAEHLRRELAISQADLAKKQAELDRLSAERDRLGGVLSRLSRR